MKHYIVTSAVGKDQPGFVNRITGVIRGLGGNVELQRSTRMAEEFAAIILFSMEGDEAAAALAMEALRDLQSDDCMINARSAVGSGRGLREGDSLAELTASGADQPGIIEEVTLLLFRRRINIESMDYDVDSAPMTGTELFSMHARLAVPGDADIETLKEEFRDLEDRLNFDILFRHPVRSG